MKPAFEPPRSRQSPCPCGSGRKYKHCHGAQPTLKAHPNRQWLGWVLGAAVVIGIGALIGRKPSAPPPAGGGVGFPLFDGGVGESRYTRMDGVDMSRLSDEQRARVMRTANAQRCTCGCRMTLAQCINTDMICPLRTRNFQRARQLVAQAAGDS